MVMGYHQIKLAPGEGPKTAFSTKQGHREYWRLPVGLKTAPATFQKMMNSVFSGLTSTRCFLYVDDIVLYARSLAEHNTKLREVLNRLRTYKLKLQRDKCVSQKGSKLFGSPNNRGRGKAGPLKGSGNTAVSHPHYRETAENVLWHFSYYRRFIPNCSRIASPLYKLLKKDAKFVWTEA